MKKIAIIFPATLLMACGGNPETTVPTENTDTVQTQVQQETTEENIYEKDWRNFKIGIEDKDGPAVAYVMQLDDASYISNSEDVIMLFDDEVYAEKLANTNYSDLLDSEWEGKKVKEFRAEQVGMDDEGNTYESAIFLYFEEQEKGLKLVSILMAG